MKNSKLRKKTLLRLISGPALTSKEKHLVNFLYAIQDNCGGVCISMEDLMFMAGICHKKTFLAAKKGLEDKNIIATENRKDKKTGNQKSNYYQFTVVQNCTSTVVRTMNHGPRVKNEPLIYIYK